MWTFRKWGHASVPDACAGGLAARVAIARASPRAAAARRRGPTPPCWPRTSGGLCRGRGDVAQRLAGVDAEGEDRQRRRRHAVVHVTLHALAALRRRPVHDEVVDDLVGDGGGCRLAVTCLPRLPHVLELRAPTEPLVEGAVDGHVEVRGDGEP